MENVFYWLTLRAISGLGERSIKKLYQHYKDPKLILEADQAELEELVGKVKASRIKEKNLSFDPEQVIKVLQKEGIGCITLSDEDYFPKLREIEDPPPVLFYQGELKQRVFFGVVGTRKPDGYSVRYLRDLVNLLVSKGYAIASGGAMGIDFLSHKFCVEGGGYTVCFLGFGILQAQESLKRVVLSSGAVVSEFLPWESAEKHTFPRRNRLISGVSEGVFVVEAGENSGALITAYYAKEQGRQVYVHVGYGSSERWEGCIKLVNEGVAKLVGRLQKFELKDEKSEDPILILLNTPKTLSELSQILGIEERELSKRLGLYIAEGLVSCTGAYYHRLKQEGEEYYTGKEFIPTF
ncbi:DNA-processing protein DprA [Thermocrinis sp.]|uniref:DNA-processing protein DprA n=1 Tax=Thermocrinis sp. TaxID=2024383 RepID=UPI002FDCB505